MEKKNRKGQLDRGRYKTFLRRFWAGMADGAVFFPLIYVSRMVWAHSETLPSAALVLFHVVYSLAGLAYAILLHGFFGQTLGKMLFKVKVIDVSEEVPITMLQALRRDAVPLVLMLFCFSQEIPTIFRIGSPYDPGVHTFGPLTWIFMSFGLLWFWAEILTMLTNKKRRAVHDFIAGSVVISLPRQRPVQWRG